MGFIARALARISQNRPARVIESGGAPYLYRIFLFRWRGWSCYLHHFVSPDAERWLHDHPFDGLSLVLTGGYLEERLAGLDWPALSTTTRRVRWCNWISARSFHRIAAPRPNTWTLFLHGPKRKGWGFLECMDDAVVYLNPYGNVGDEPWWESAPTYGELLARAEQASLQVSEVIRNTMNDYRWSSE
ncbi:MAG: hypothetical protein M0Q49_02325 [Porticoccaceae bacterium]|nr:hypothetical protein [Porticoccaceae bacterium]